MSDPWSASASGASRPPQSESEQPPSAPGRAGPSRQRLLIGVAGLVVLVGAAGAVGFMLGRSSTDGGAPAQVRLAAAYEQCQSQDTDRTLSIEDGGSTIVIDTGSEYGNLAGMDCILEELGTPESIRAEMGRTTAMMGVQEAEHEGLKYSWSYHPDNGVDMVITQSTTP